MDVEQRSKLNVIGGAFAGLGWGVSFDVLWVYAGQAWALGFAAVTFTFTGMAVLGRARRA